jgi:hypothetical protein
MTQHLPLNEFQRLSHPIIEDEAPPRARRVRVKEGDVVGLLLDLGQRTLSVYLKGSRRGVMVAPGDEEQVWQGSGGAIGSAVVGCGAIFRHHYSHRAQPATTAAHSSGGGGRGGVDSGSRSGSHCGSRKPETAIEAAALHIYVYAVRRVFTTKVPLSILLLAADWLARR